MVKPLAVVATSLVCQQQVENCYDRTRMKWIGVLFSIVLCYCSRGTSSLSLSDDEANEATFAGVKHLVKPCLDDLVANLIGQEDADGHILYEARESFELTPRRFKAIVAKVQHQLRRALHQSAGQSHRKLKE